jgi:hypothetical protein
VTQEGPAATTGRMRDLGRRKGTLAYLDAWEVRRARLYDRCQPEVGIAPLERRVQLARRFFRLATSLPTEDP